MTARVAAAGRNRCWKMQRGRGMTWLKPRRPSARQRTPNACAPAFAPTTTSYRASITVDGLCSSASIMMVVAEHRQTPPQ